MGLNIIACVKSVISNMLPGTNRSSSDNIELNAFDIPAIQMALALLKEHHGTLTVVSMGPESATFGIYQAMAMGAGRGILICDQALKESDTYVTAKVLGKTLQRLQPFDIVLFGTRSADSDTGHVGPQTAQMLNIPFVGNIHSINLDTAEVRDNREKCGDAEKREKVTGWYANKKRWLVERRADGYMEKFEVEVDTQSGTPVAFSVSPSFGESGSASLYGIETAFENRNIEIWNNATLGLAPEETGINGSPTKIIAWNKEKRTKKCEFIEGTPEQKAEKLAQRLAEKGFVG